MRNDDIDALIARIEQQHTGNKRPKIRQRWTGVVVVEVRHNGATALQDLLDRIERQSSSRWVIEDKSYGSGWISFVGSYTAKGANADDAEKMVRRLAAKGNEITVGEIGIHTTNIVPAAEG